MTPQPTQPTNNQRSATLVDTRTSVPSPDLTTFFPSLPVVRPELPSEGPPDPSPDTLDSYLSIRVTTPHTSWDDIVRVLLNGVPDYVAYPHTGKLTDKAHFHIFIPCSASTAAERYRNRLRRHFGASGNKTYSISFKSNGILSAIQYGSKEGTTPYVSSPAMQECVSSAPAWEERLAPSGLGPYLTHSAPKRKLDENHHFPITVRNILKASLRYRTTHAISSMELEHTLEAMHADNWFLDAYLMTHGIHPVTFSEFTARCQGKTVMTASRFAMMRNTDLEKWKSFDTHH